jgi:dipeptidyl aminopeptidase/acylaminoacyl peptidase
MSIVLFRPSLLLPILFLAFYFCPVGNTEAQNTYQLPPPEIVEILDSTPLPETRVSPDGTYLLFIYRYAMPSIDDLAVQFLNLAGLRIDPRTNSNYTPTGRTYALKVKEMSTGGETEINVPPDPNIGSIEWSPDGKYIAFTQTNTDGVELWFAEVASGLSARVPGLILNDIGSSSILWMPGSQQILARSIPDNRGSPPEPVLLPAGPIVQVADGRPAPARTYQNLLRNPRDELAFEYYFTSQLVLVDRFNLTFQKIGEPGIFRENNPSPDGKYILASSIGRPYSYMVPYWRFPHEVEIFHIDGQKLKTLVSVPLAEHIPLFGVVTEPRGHRWNPDREAQIVFIEALDGGDPAVEAEYRDAIYSLEVPFDGTPQKWMKTQYRFESIAWGNDLALINEYDRPTNRTRTWLYRTDTGKANLLFDRDRQDRYNDPGSPVFLTDRRGNRVLLQGEEADIIYLQGPGASPKGDFPFLDRFDLETGTAKRLWQSDTLHNYESVVYVLGRGAERLITRRETRTEPPNYLILDMQSGGEVRLTDFNDPHPQLTGIHRELITYTREDGIQLSATLYLPAGYREGDRPPLVIWIYPLDYTSADAASQVRGNPNRFTFFRGATHLFFLTQGYAVLDGPSLPIIGEYGNDTYVEQTVAGITAAIRKIDEMGVADTRRIGVGGHSYGAFSTVNLLIHSDLFLAGIARSGAYNRTLTPFGFQNERRTFWEAQDTYMRVSPFTHADKIKKPLLILHGMADSNSGTFPIQSERLFHVIRGLGGSARYVQYPFEDHGYRARESVLDALFHMVDWFDRYVKKTELVVD